MVLWLSKNIERPREVIVNIKRINNLLEMSKIEDYMFIWKIYEKDVAKEMLFRDVGCIDCKIFAGLINA